MEKAEKEELHVSVLELRCSLHVRESLLTMTFSQQSLNNQHSFVVAVVLIYLRPLTGSKSSVHWTGFLSG